MRPPIPPRVLAALALLALAGCGYRPLYGNGSAPGEAVGAGLDSVKIAQVQNRNGQMLHNALRDRINPRGVPGSPAYLLLVRLDETTQTLGVRRDELTTRANLLQTAQFELRDAKSDVLLSRGRSQATTSYDTLQSRYASYAAEDDARKRGIALLAEDVRLQVALFLNRRTGATAPPPQ